MAFEPMNGTSRRIRQARSSAFAPSMWRASSRVRTVGLAGAITLLASAHGVAVWSGDAGGSASTFVTLGIVVTSLAALSWSAWGLLESNMSRRRHVFRGRRVAWCAGILALVAGALVASLVMRDPFRGFFASGRITAHELVDVGDILGAVVSLTFAATAALAAWGALDEERHWGRSLGIGS